MLFLLRVDDIFNGCGFNQFHTNWTGFGKFGSSHSVKSVDFNGMGFFDSVARSQNCKHFGM